MEKLIEFSVHALVKLEMLQEHGFVISQEQLVQIIHNPESLEKGYKERWVAQAAVSEQHVLRVVY